MILMTLASAVLYKFVTETFEVKAKQPGSVYYETTIDPRFNSKQTIHESVAVVKPLAETQFRGIIKQAYDYSCGSAALTTILNGYMGANQTEKQTMDGLLKYGEYEKIVRERRFSLLDMKRYVTALGLNGAGYKASFGELITLNKPAIVPIHYAGFKHFVVYKGHKDGRVYVADPALGNISFADNNFKAVWDNNTLFLVDKPDGKMNDNFLAITDDDLRHVDDNVIRSQIAIDDFYQVNTFEKFRDRVSTLDRVVDADAHSVTSGNNVEISYRLYYHRK